jgi:hypothetical protein
MMDYVNVYVLTNLSIDGNGEVKSKVVGVTFNIHEAEAHRAKGVENEFDTFQIDSDWREDAEVTATVLAMRAFREIVALQVEEALR